MGNSNKTASAIMSYSEKFERGSAALYERLAEQFDRDNEVFLKFAEDSKKNKILLVRTYQETISDALEATFSFEGIDLIEYDFEKLVGKEASHKEALQTAMKIEDYAAKLYTQIADRGRSLLATIPRAFERVAKKRRERIEVLQGLIDKTY